MNKFLAVSLLVLCLAVTLKASASVQQPSTDFVNANPGVETPDNGASKKCHDSCNCLQNNTLCAECNVCTQCKQPNMAVIVGTDFCECLTPQFRLKDGSNWECEKTPDYKEIRPCEWQIFNQIYNMVVHSNCGLVKEGAEQTTYVQDAITYDWRRVVGVPLDDSCKQELLTEVQYSKNCDQVYAPLPLKYVSDLTSSSTTIKIALIDVYDLASVSQLNDRHIFQRVCLALQLSNIKTVVRLHRFELRVYTLRDQVQVFHLNVSKQVTDGCDQGQECVVVANLDTKGQICENKLCNAFKTSTPTYIVGEHMFVRISFLDSTYTNYLTVISVKFTDLDGIYGYTKGTQWWTINQPIGFVDVEILLFQPHNNADIEVALKISDHADPQLRQLAVAAAQDQSADITQMFKASVVAGAPAKNAAADQSAFAMNLFFGASLAAFALLI